MTTNIEGSELVAAVRAAAARHSLTWEQLVPSSFVIDHSAEAAEEEAYRDMAEVKKRLRDHICATYGLSIRELSSLAMP
jgi:hypothetical protein